MADEAKHGHTIASTVTVNLKDGRALVRKVESFKGTPEQPLDRSEMREKFLLLTKACDGAAMTRLFERLQNIDSERSLDWLKVTAKKKASKTPPARKRAPAKRKK